MRDLKDIGERELAGRIAGGERGHVEAALCERFMPRIRAFGLLHLRNEDAASELVQEVLVGVLAALREGRVCELERLPAFVMGTCRNTVLNWHSRTRRQGALLELFAAGLTDSWEPEVSALDLERLRGCLKKLPPREGTLITLTFFGELSSEQIGDELGLKSGAVRVARHRALKRLLTCLESGT